MAVIAPVSGLSLAAVARLSAVLSLPEFGAAGEKQARLPDVVVFSSAPMRLLSDLASAGLRQLAILLPIMHQAAQEQSVVPLGHLAKAAGAAARQIAEGHQALLAEGPDRVAAVMREPTLSRNDDAAPNPATDTKQLLRTLSRQIGAETEAGPSGRPDETLRTIARQLGTDGPIDPHTAAQPGAGPIQRWLGEAKHLLHGTGEVLDRAAEQVGPLVVADHTLADPPNAWVLAEINAAQSQIALAYASVQRAAMAPPSGYRAGLRPQALATVASATTLLGVLLVLATLWLVGGVWSLAIGAVALGSALIWARRIGKATQALTLDARS